VIELTTQEVLTLIDFCSKACLLHTSKIAFDNPVEGLQFSAAQQAAVPILALLDERYPGVIPMPHDGVGWKDRIALGGE